MIDSAAIADALGSAGSAPTNDFDSSKIAQAMQEAAAPKVQPPEIENTNIRKLALPFTKNPEDLADMAQVGHSMVSSIGHQVVGGLYGSGVGAFDFVKNLANGDDVATADQKASAVAAEATNKVQADAYQPTRQGAKDFNEWKYNPANIIGSALSKAGDVAGDKVNEVAGPVAGALTKGLVEVSPNFIGLRGAKGSTKGVVAEDVAKASDSAPIAASEPATVSTAKVYEEPIDVPEGKKPSVNTEDIKAKADLLQRIGLDRVRENVLKGDKFGSAVDFQLSKSPEAAGQAARDQLQNERNALESHAQNIIADTKGSIGVNEDALYSRGSKISEPFDAYRDYFKKAEENLYKQADEQSNGLPVVKTGSIDQLLSDRTFKNTMMAQKQEPLLNALRDQLDAFKENNPNGLTVKNAEQMRQWINKNWSPENSSILKEVKSALDNDVFSSAGSDIYAAGRKMHQLKLQTLDNPNGIAKLFDHDPFTPGNRTTAHEKIPDTIYRLPLDQYKNVIDTLRKMPEELQPQAQQAINEIKSHAANKIHESGSKTQSQWDARAVNDYIKKNSAKLDYIFDKPEEVAKIADLQSAGNLLRVETSYPGAAAQTQQFLKRGVGANLITPAAAAAGEGIFSMLGMPLGVGSAAGATLGRKASMKQAEGAATKKFEKSVTNLNDITKVKK